MPDLAQLSYDEHETQRSHRQQLQLIDGLAGSSILVSPKPHPTAVALCRRRGVLPCFARKVIGRLRGGWRWCAPVRELHLSDGVELS